MAIPKVRTLFDSNASPQTGVSLSNSVAWRAWDSDSVDDGPIHVTVYATGTWNGVTLKFEVSPGDTSPLTWVTAQALDPAAGKLTDAAMTANGSIVLSIPQGSYIRAVISDTSSPEGVPALVIKAMGQLVAA